MPIIRTTEHSLKTEHRLKIRIGGQLSHFLDLRVPPGRDVDFLFHVSNSHAKVDPKFVTDNMQGVLAAHFGTDVEDGNERCVAREAVIDLGGGDLAYFRVQGIGVFSSSFQRARSKLDRILNAYRISEVPERASFEIIKLGIGGTYSSRSIDLRRGRAQSENELRLHYGPDFLPWQELILNVMAKKCAGIHLLRGETGTGKSFFIRHLVQVLRTSHRFYFLPSYEYARVGNGALIEFLQDEQDDHPNLQFVIVMEDAEAVLMPRKIDTGFSVSALLNLTDGLLGEGLNLQFICTVNCEIAELDTAIVRPGRLRTARDFRLLTHSEAIELAEHCGLPIPRERREYSLAEIYNPDEASVNGMRARQVGFSTENP
jgi:ATPase family associated with various cellular activities (AAA)